MVMGVPAHLRRINERLVFSQLVRGGPASRAELAKATGLSAPTVGKVVDEFLEAGFLEEVEEVEGARSGRGTVGRPGRLVRLDQSRRRLVAVQLGVHHTRVAAWPVAGPGEQETWPVEFSTPESGEQWQNRLREAAERLGVKESWAVMVSVPGVVDEAAGKVLLSANLHWTEGADLVGLVREVFGVPVHLVQEIRALALGQLTAEPGEGDFLLVDFGAGVGGAVVTGGKLYEGPTPLTGELGHSRVLGNRRRCGCGGEGCLETVVSRRGLMESAKEAWGKEVGSWGQLVEELGRRGLEGWLVDVLEAAGAVIGSALNVLGVRRVVLTGIPYELAGLVAEPLGRAIERSAMWGRFGRVSWGVRPRRRGLGLVAAAFDRVLLPGLG